MTQEQAMERAHTVWSNSEYDRASTCNAIANELLSIERETEARVGEDLFILRRDMLRVIKQISTATVTIPWEAGYGPEYVPTAGDPEKSIKDLIAVIVSKTEARVAKRCAEIAWGEVAVAIRREFALKEGK